MAVSDLTNTTWVINDTEQFLSDEPTVVFTANITFTSNGNTYTSLHTTYTQSVTDDYTIYYNNTLVADFVYDEGWGWWEDQAYRTIEITGGTDVTNATLISWLEANAIQQAEPTGTVLKIYNNDERATAYDIYVQGGSYVTPTKLATVQRPAPPGYEFTISFNTGGFTVYDGQDNTGTLIGSAPSSGTQITGTCYSGYLFAAYDSGPGYAYIIMEAYLSAAYRDMEILDYSSNSVTIQVTGDNASGVVNVLLD